MTRNLFFLFLASMLTIGLTACGGKEEVKEEESVISISDGDNEVNISVDNVDEAMNEVKNAFKNIKIDREGSKEVVNFRDLKDLLPNRAGGMKRVSHGGERTGMMGINVSTAEAVYEDGDKQVEVTITDAGGITALAAGMVAWTNMEIDKESDRGYERTTTINGDKAFEEYDSEYKSGKISLFVEERFIVSLEGDNVGSKDLRKVLDDINIRKLKKMAD